MLQTRRGRTGCPVCKNMQKQWRSTPYPLLFESICTDSFSGRTLYDVTWEESAAAGFARRLSKVPKCERTYCPHDIGRTILFGIKSTASNHSIERRDTIRRSFVRQIKEYPQATYTFVLSRPSNENAEPIQREADSNRDITFLELNENHHIGVTTKTLWWFKRVTQESDNQYDWVCHVDDDSYVQVIEK